MPGDEYEGRLITLEFERMFLVFAYVPNSGQGLKRLTYRTTVWDTAMLNHLNELKKRKAVLWTGDLNVSLRLTFFADCS